MKKIRRRRKGVGTPARSAPFKPPVDWGISIGPAYQLGWERMSEPAVDASGMNCTHCKSYNLIAWQLKKEFLAFGNIVIKYATVFECRSCGNETWVAAGEVKKPKPKLDPSTKDRLAKFMALSPEAQEEVLKRLKNRPYRPGG